MREHLCSSSHDMVDIKFWNSKYPKAIYIDYQSISFVTVGGLFQVHGLETTEETLYLHSPIKAKVLEL